MNAAEFRRWFPMLAQITHLATCSLGARSSRLDRALGEMSSAMAAQGAPWREFEHQAGLARRRFAALVGAVPDQIALLPNASIAAFQIASTRPWAQRPQIVAVGSEFPSIAHVWQAQREAELLWVRTRDGDSAGDVVGAYAAAVGERVGLVSVPLTSYRESRRMPVAEIVGIAHAAGAPVFVDAYQAAGVEPIDVGESGCDYLVAGASKYLLGLPGVAFLYVRSPAEEPTPSLTGWFGRVDPFRFDPHLLDHPDHARRFETGTPAVPALYAANAGFDLLAQVDVRDVRRHVGHLTAAAAQLLTDAGERLVGPVDPALRGAHVALLDPDPEGLAAWLADRRIVVSPRGDVGRLAFHYYNDLDDVLAACDGIARHRRSVAA